MISFRATCPINLAAFAGEEVKTHEMTTFLASVRARSRAVQAGSNMLFEQIPAGLEFFGFPTTTAEELRNVAKIMY